MALVKAGGVRIISLNFKFQSSNVKSNPKLKIPNRFELWILVICLSFGFWILKYYDYQKL